MLVLSRYRWFSIMFTAVVILFLLTPTAHALTLLGVDLNCDPELAPESGGCGLPHIIELLGGIINFLLTTIVLPVATLMIIWGGFYILTAGGSEEKFKKGKKIITVAVIGVALAFSFGIIVSIVYNIFAGTDAPTFNLF